MVTEFKKKISRFLAAKEPFFFIINFDCTDLRAYSFEEALKKNIKFNLRGIHNFQESQNRRISIDNPLIVEPFGFENYLNSFEKVVSNLKSGNSFLANLTFPSRVISKIELNEVFETSNASYKLLFKDQFVCFSPECFVKIANGYIYSYPMKGTIDASIEDAENILLNDPKEEQEHNTIVDLIRNDLSMVSREVTVTKFRFIERIKTVYGEILQTSSEIRGKLAVN